MNIISIDEFDDATMTRIFNSITDWHFAKGFEAAFVRNGKVGYLTLTMSLGSLISTIRLYFIEVSIQFGILLWWHKGKVKTELNWLGHIIIYIITTRIVDCTQTCTKFLPAEYTN